MRDPIAVAMRQSGKTRLEVLEIMRDQLNKRVADTDTRKESVIAKLDTAIAYEKDMDERLKGDVIKVLSDNYTLSNGTEVKGQSISYVRQLLREQGWKNISGYRLENELERVGFKVSRGRGFRSYHGGVRKLGVECTVVHEQSKRS